MIKDVELSRRRFSRDAIWQDNCDVANQYSGSNVVALRATFLESISIKQLSCETYRQGRYRNPRVRSRRVPALRGRR